MKSISFLKTVFAVSVLSSSLFSTTVLAKDINLYEQPMTTSKVVGTIDTATGVIPIYSPKGSDWMKIGDPRNGNVGWVKSSDISAGGSTSFSFTQKVIKDGKEQPESYSIQIGVPNKQQMDQFLQNIQKDQGTIQQTAQKMMGQMIENINRLYKQQPELLHNNSNSPVILPIVIVPASDLKAPAKK